MIEGLLWFDANTKRDLSEKVTLAAARYRERFGYWPDTCYVNGDQWPELPEAVGSVRLVGADNILKHHFWIGVEEQPRGNGNGGVLVCRRCGAESLDLDATACWSCGWDGKE